MSRTAPSYARHAIDILVIGGDAEATACYRGLLSAGGWRVGSAAALPRAITSGRRPRLILLCGWDAVRTFSSCTTLSLPVRDMVVVAYCPPNTELTFEALDGGVDLVIAQPCSPTLLVRRLRSALRWAVL